MHYIFGLADSSSQFRLTWSTHSLLGYHLNELSTVTKTLLLTVPMAHKMLFLMIAAMSSMNSSEVAQGSMHVVMMYLTESSVFGSN